MNNFIIQGVIVSKVACNHERIIRAKRENKELEDVPLRYGSLRMVVNLIQLDGISYLINRKPQEKGIKEERLILEISYRFDYKKELQLARIIDEHSIIYNMNQDDYLEIELSHGFIVKNHYMTIINPGTKKPIKTYFLKAWANDIVNVSDPVIKPQGKKIRPVSVIRCMNVDQTLRV